MRKQGGWLTTKVITYGFALLRHQAAASGGAGTIFSQGTDLQARPKTRLKIVSTCLVW